MQIDEVIEDLVKAKAVEGILKAEWMKNPTVESGFRLANTVRKEEIKFIDQALAKLREVPKPTEFTKELREHLERSRKSMGFAIWTQAKKACGIIEQQAADLAKKG